MKLGINGTGLVQRASVAAVEADAKQAEQDGFHSYWLAEHPTGGFDALTVLSLVGQSVQRDGAGHRHHSDLSTSPNDIGRSSAHGCKCVQKPLNTWHWLIPCLDDGRARHCL